MVTNIKIKKIILYMVVVLYPYLPIIKEWNPQRGLIIEAILLVLLALSSVLKYEGRTVKLSIHKSAGFLSVLLIIYFFINISSAYAAFSGLRALLLYIFFFSLENDDDNTRSDYIYTSAIASIIASFVMGAGCIVQFIYPPLIKTAHNPSAWDMLRYKTDWKAFGIYNRALSFMTDPNVLSVYLAFSLFITVILFKYFKKKIYVFVGFVQMIAIVLTQSRTGIFVVLLFVVFSLFFNMLRGGKLTTNKFMFVATVGVLALIYIVRYWNRLLLFLRVDTLLAGNGRTVKNAMQISTYFSDVFSLFFGHGLFDGREIIFENSYLMTIYMFGVIGTCLFLVLSYKTYRSVITKQNIEILLCYAASIFVGDYILIPQVTLIAVLGLLLNKYYNKEINNNGLVE